MKSNLTHKFFLVTFSLLLLLSQSGFSQIDSVFYHDGSFESQYGNSGAQPSADYLKCVTRFTPPYYPARLLGLKAWFRNSGDPSEFNWVVYKDPAGTATGPGATPDYYTSAGYNNPAVGGVTDSAYSAYIDLTAQNIIITSGDVYGGVTQHTITNGFMGAAIDNTNAFTTDRPWVYFGLWYQMQNYAFINGEWAQNAYFTPVITGVANPYTESSELSISPNPTAHSFVVDLNLNDDVHSDVSIQLINTLGQLVYVTRPQMKNGVLHSEINPEIPLADGNYLVRVITNARVYTSPLMVHE